MFKRSIGQKIFKFQLLILSDKKKLFNRYYLQCIRSMSGQGKLPSSNRYNTRLLTAERTG